MKNVLIIALVCSLAAVAGKDWGAAWMASTLKVFAAPAAPVPRVPPGYEVCPPMSDVSVSRSWTPYQRDQYIVMACDPNAQFTKNAQARIIALSHSIQPPTMIMPY
jgi:hypothetical protein